MIKKVEKNRKNLLPNPYTGANIIEPLKRAQNTWNDQEKKFWKLKKSAWQTKTSEVSLTGTSREANTYEGTDLENWIECKTWK